MFPRSNEKDSHKLQPSNLNDLLAAFVAKQTDNINVQLQFLSGWGLEHSGQQQCGFHVIQKEDKIFILFNVTKDAASKENNPYLPYIGDVLKQALKQALKQGSAARYLASENPDLQVSMLFPVAQCRGYLKSFVRKAHYVMLEVNPRDLTMQIHDSQDRVRYLFYPDKFKNDEFIKNMKLTYNPAKDYHSYNAQKDDVVCGYYVAEYIKALVEGRDCRDVHIKKMSDNKIIVMLGDSRDDTYGYADKREYLQENGIKFEENPSSSLRSGNASDDDFTMDEHGSPRK